MFARNILQALAAGALLSAFAWGQPNLTTISDTLFKADGMRFNGLARFTWLSFDAANGTNIAQQMTTVRIIDGNLFVQLAPTTDRHAANQSIPSSTRAMGRFSSVKHGTCHLQRLHCACRT